MEIHFLGVGEACDGRQPNTAVLVRTGARDKTGRILLDCGFSVPHRYLSLDPHPEELDVLWISHLHGDHFLGTPLLLLWFWEMGRQKPLHIMGPPGVAAKIKQAMELAYPNLWSRLGFSLSFLEMKPGEQKKTSDTVWQAAYSEHSLPCLALRLELHGKALFYSGDGRPTPMTLALARGCALIIHEAYGLEDTTLGHGSIAACLEFARNAGGRQLAVVHMHRSIRPRSRTAIAALAKKYPEVTILLPETGDRISL